MNMTSLPKSLAHLVREATGGERLIWLGRPHSGRILRQGLWSWMFALPWTVFSMAWTSVPVSVLLFAQGPDKMGGWGIPAMAVMALFGLPFVAIGLSMMAEPFRAAARARQTAIALTGQRIVIVTNGRAVVVRSIPLTSIVRFELRPKRDGSGDLRLDLGAKRDSEGDKLEISEELVGVGDVVALERALRAAVPRLEA